MTDTISELIQDDGPIEPGQTERMVPGVRYCKLIFDLETNRIKIISYDREGQRIGTRSFNDDPQGTINKQIKFRWQLLKTQTDAHQTIVYLKLDPN